jgi:hypothetical protein
MKTLTLLATISFCVAGHMSIAKPIKTRVWDRLGTTFIVSVDWETNVVSAKLRANPGHLSGDALEQSMQKAVYYGAGVDCQMGETGRKNQGGGEIVGALHCPWSDRAQRPST